MAAEGTAATQAPDAAGGWTSALRPRLFAIIDIHDETADVRTLRLQPADGGPMPTWSAGQFAEYSAFGAGEAVFTLANSPTRGDAVEFSFRVIGKVTTALRNLGKGQIVGWRGPYGNSFPVEAWKGKNLVFVGGGIGTVALRAAIQYVLDNRADYGDITILNGARTVGDLCYEREAPQWASIPGVKVVRTVDPGGASPEWTGEVGLIPNVFERLGAAPGNRVVVTCGPPIMLHYMFLALEKLGYPPDDVVTTLENKMKCGLGLCGRCNAGRYFVCVDGPVFTLAQLKGMPVDY